MKIDAKKQTPRHSALAGVADHAWASDKFLPSSLSSPSQIPLYSTHVQFLSHIRQDGLFRKSLFYALLAISADPYRRLSRASTSQSRTLDRTRTHPDMIDHSTLIRKNYVFLTVVFTSAFGMELYAQPSLVKCAAPDTDTPTALSTTPPTVSGTRSTRAYVFSDSRQSPVRTTNILCSANGRTSSKDTSSRTTSKRCIIFSDHH